MILLSLRQLCIIVVALLLLYSPIHALQKDIPLKIHTQDGRLIPLKVEVPETDQEKQKGLMFRKSLSLRKGMLFLYPSPVVVSVWMKNTLIPLDVLFFNQRGEITHIDEQRHPLDETPQGPKEKSSGFLEVPAGAVQYYKIKIGDFLYPLPFNSQTK